MTRRPQRRRSTRPKWGYRRSITFDRYNREELYDSIGIDLACEEGGACVDLRQGFDWRSLVAQKGGLDPRYGKAAIFNPGFQGRLLIKFIF